MPNHSYPSICVILHAQNTVNLDGKIQGPNSLLEKLHGVMSAKYLALSITILKIVIRKLAESTSRGWNDRTCATVYCTSKLYLVSSFTNKWLNQAFNTTERFGCILNNILYSPSSHYKIATIYCLKSRQASSLLSDFLKCHRITTHNSAKLLCSEEVQDWRQDGNWKASCGGDCPSRLVFKLLAKERELFCW